VSSPECTSFHKLFGDAQVVLTDDLTAAIPLIFHCDH
jgi:hypothetical protein